MRMRPATAILLASGVALCCACGTASPPTDRASVPTTQTDSGGSSSSENLDGSGPDLEASSNGPDGPSDTIPDAAGGGADSARPGSDAGVVGSDGGQQPFKGVANSACGDLARLGVTWWYNWTQSPSGCTASQFVPMIWGHTGNEQSPTGIAMAIGSLVSAGYRTVLGFNEPDNSGQSNISVATAISLWPSFDDPSMRLGSPATQGNSA